ncbi:3-oxoacyl-[acyl-carrier-protein] synthase 3 [Endomicrobiia bacterium]|uniref:Beta-ketoacyl-[acyl-carrier-protein] synthase III n=1 Tax=Endomicrobium trichonymphae TaxID=1408204 RepID=B1H0Q5_ENDTX|nr:beta-ketoacyl-ACP synthase III [Candidatus Endomicrobium trichonymphae]BAG14087.1 3-oxoacyl-[acyl-carrier-protein] synthase III [Candidatus Endomicrobium trichonymphae]BAV59146.1 3-oxoacyl-[acyl-carrier-protein] synthase III [Candidatus Endomicrobium trichonymphae]GHT24230.1 3-oxoacyl-[acyl-carrier-protein] synthase 3 [Endomicrobiia bacterium]GMO53253.1 MAG: ketoacyl-ACP synthase III [Candidatus Endomicrobium trichonymphae]
MNKKIGTEILGTGSYFPKKVLTNADLEKMIDTSDEWIRTRTGIKERRVSEKNEPTSELAYKASIEALEDAGILPEQIDLIIIATMTPDMLVPSTACFLHKRLGLTNSAPSFDLSAACSGFIYGISAAKAFIESGLYKTILLVGAEELTKFMDWTDRNTCILFGDGAGAIVLSASEENDNVLSVFLGADGSYSNLLFLPACGTACYDPADDMNGHTIKMQGKEVFKSAVPKMVLAAEKALSFSKKELKDIKLFIPHQANMRIIEAVAKKMGVSMDRVFVNVHKTGNISAATTITALDEAIKTGRLQKGDLAELIAFGSGFTWGATVIRI